ncbi:MAG: MarC family protein [Opitutales bacterium]|nr:MarC family protein [Opitutales bacterium]
MEAIQFFLQYFMTIFVVISPLAIMALFICMTASYTVPERIKSAKMGCKVGGALLVFFAITGKKIFEFFGISMGSFYIAGGILIFLIGLSMLRSQDADTQTDDGANNGKKVSKVKEDISITPLGVPFIAGPACITTAIAQQARATNWVEWTCGLVALLLVIYVLYWLLVISARGAKWLTPTVLRLSYRLSGLILAALAIEMIITGIKSDDLGLWSCNDQVEARMVIEGSPIDE